MYLTSTTSITEKEAFDLSGMLYGKKGYTEDRKTITQKTLLDKTWIQDSYLCTQYDMKDVAAMLSLNYQFNENHSLGARYDYDRTPERYETVDPMNTLVYQDDALYEESHTSGWRNTQETRHTLNAYYNGRIGGLEYRLQRGWFLVGYEESPGNAGAVHPGGRFLRETDCHHQKSDRQYPLCYQTDFWSSTMGRKPLFWRGIHLYGPE